MGVEKNLLIRKFIKEIIYSKEKILIYFIYSDYSVEDAENLFCEKQTDFSESNSARRGKNLERDSVVNNHSVSNDKAVALKMAVNNQHLRRIPVEIPNIIHNSVGKLL